MKQAIVLVFIFFFSLSVGVGIIVALRVREVNNIRRQVFSPDVIPFTPPVPAESIPVYLDKVVKEVMLDLGKGPKEATSGAILVPGNTVMTEKGAQATILVGDADTVEVGQDSEVDFISSLPQSILFEQKKGSVVYEAKGELSVRSGPALIALKDGRAEISMVPAGRTSVLVEQGEVQVGMNDEANKTLLEKGQAGQKIVIDAIGRTITVH